MTNPIKKIQGGINQVKATTKSLHTAQKYGDPNMPATKMAAGAKMGVSNVVKAFKVGAANPAAAKTALRNANNVATSKKADAKGVQVAQAGIPKTGKVVTAMGKAQVGAGAKPAIKPGAPKMGQGPAAGRGPLTPQQKAQQAKATQLKGTLNNAFPGLNMK
jgi:hypothetical protein